MMQSPLQPPSVQLADKDGLLATKCFPVFTQQMVRLPLFTVSLLSCGFTWVSPAPALVLDYIKSPPDLSQFFTIRQTYQLVILLKVSRQEFQTILSDNCCFNNYPVPAQFKATGISSASNLPCFKEACLGWSRSALMTGKCFYSWSVELK